MESRQLDINRPATMGRIRLKSRDPDELRAMHCQTSMAPGKFQEIRTRRSRHECLRHVKSSLPEADSKVYTRHQKGVSMRFLLFTFILTFAARLILAQQDMGVITGIVTDTSGGVIAQVNVSVSNQETNETRQALTGPTGAFTLGPLRVGSYDLTVEKAGFKKRIWKGIEVHAQDRVRADVQMELGQISETVSVTAEAPILQSETSSLSQVVEERQVRELPLNGRNFQQLAWLTAGVSPDTRGRDRDSGFNSHGQAFTQNSFIIDGIDNNNNIMGMQDRKMQVVIPSLDAVAEFKVETSNYSAEFGRNSGALMIVSIKSGSNQFHGSGYEYLRN